MKHIKKSAPPQQLISWAAANAGLPSLRYGHGGFPHPAVHKSLIAEQGCICAYTMIRIDESTSHVEHLKPQTVSRKEENPSETADYRNIVACYPKQHIAGDPPVKFGAIFRGEAWDPVKFLSPLNAACEARIRFGTDGKVRPWKSTDAGAKWTIGTLALDASSLTEYRRAAIEARGVSLAADEPLTRKEAQRIVAGICTRNTDGRFHPYCVAIKHAAEEYLRLIEKKAKRRNYVRASQKRGRK
ncbi:MAG: TIGR02646 family protein [Planctomycetota bacterium]|nr:TIGR02646 family protein [Planctomycetota bacterium]